MENTTQLVGAVSYAMSLDVTRPHLTQVLLERSGGVLSVVATDGHRMAIATRPDAGPDAAEVTITPKHDAKLRRLGWPGAAGAASFPPWRRALPDTSRDYVRHFLKRDHVLAAARACMAVRGKDSRPRAAMLRAVGSQRLELRASSDDGVEIVASCQRSFDRVCGIEIGVDARYLVDAIDTIDGGDVTIDMHATDALCPIVVASPARDRVCVIMPMRA